MVRQCDIVLDIILNRFTYFWGDKLACRFSNGLRALVGWVGLKLVSETKLGGKIRKPAIFAQALELPKILPPARMVVAGV